MERILNPKLAIKTFGDLGIKDILHITVSRGGRELVRTSGSLSACVRNPLKIFISISNPASNQPGLSLLTKEPIQG